LCILCDLILLLERSVVEQIFDFVTNHYVLVSFFVFLLVAFVINEGKQGGAAITPTNLVNLVNREGAMLLDIRDSKEYSSGHIAGAVSMPVSSIDARIGELESHKDKPVVLVCKMGQHASATGRKLKALGFENVRRLSGGMTEWTASSLPVVK
jgi:rhodanese-related sulfurtransferase